MKVAITALKNSLDSPVDTHFGRAAYFVIYDKKIKSIEFLPNHFLSMDEGAGAAAMQFLSEQGISQVISGEIGQKIKTLIDSLRIQMIILKDNAKTIHEIIDLLDNNNEKSHEITITGSDQISNFNKNKTMKKRIAIPLENGSLCQHFGHCQQFSIIDIDENNQVGNEERITPPEHQPGLYPAWVSQHGVTDVIAGGIGQKAIDLFHQQKINVFVGAEMKEPKALAADFANNTLHAGANYCDH